MRVELEERREAARELLEDLRTGKHPVPRGFVNRAVREAREAR